MKLPAGSEKWGVGVLGLVSLLSLANLVQQYRGMQPRHSVVDGRRTGALSARPKKAEPHVADDLAKYDPSVHLAALKALDSRPLPDEERNPFEFVGGPAPVVQAPAAVAAAPVAPPPPPPPPLKAVGYNELPGGKKEAMVTFNDDLSVVHEGDTVGSKFKILKISPTAVTIEDGDTHQTLDLPFPQ